MIKLGLTGSIGMGKSTTAQFFAEAGVPVWDADAAVHRLYASGGAAVGAVTELCPDANVDGAIDRDKLKSWIATEPGALAKLEATVHPLVATDREAFLAKHANVGLVVLDVPLLFETGDPSQYDAILVVSTDAATQAERVLARANMTKSQLDRILERQMPDAEKRARADFVIETRTLEQTRKDVESLIQQLTGKRHA